MEKNFINRKPNTSYSITDEGMESFSSHLRALEELIKNT
jgi:predicted transcriptional regulator